MQFVQQFRSVQSSKQAGRLFSFAPKAESRCTLFNADPPVMPGRRAAVKRPSAARVPVKPMRKYTLKHCTTALNEDHEGPTWSVDEVKERIRRWACEHTPNQPLKISLSRKNVKSAKVIAFRVYIALPASGVGSQGSVHFGHQKLTHREYASKQARQVRQKVWVAEGCLDGAAETRGGGVHQQAQAGPPAAADE